MTTLYDSLYSAFEVADSGINARIQHISRLIRHGLREIDTLHRAHSVMQRELDAFLAGYYKRILPLYDTLEKLRHPTTYIPIPESAYLEVSESSDSELDSRLKSIYRHLAKASHPDYTRHTHDSVYSIQQVIEAYKEKNISTLWWMQITQMSTHSMHNDALLEYLKSEWDQIVSSVQSLRNRKRDLQASTTWGLMERCIAAQLQGIDLIQCIAASLQQKINALINA